MKNSTTAGAADWAVTDYEGSIDYVLERGYTGGITVAADYYNSDYGVETGSFGGARYLPIFAYTGRYLDPDTGLQWNGERWYSPSLGRFVSKDPIGFNGDPSNLYRYVGNSPTNYTDPSGLQDPGGPPDYSPDPVIPPNFWGKAGQWIKDLPRNAWYGFLGLVGSIPTPKGALAFRANLATDECFVIHYGDPSQSGYYTISNFPGIYFHYFSPGEWNKGKRTPISY